MPGYLFEQNLPPEHDKRRKILVADHEKVKLDYQEIKSYKKVADKWNVSKRTIMFICNPESLKEFQRKRYLLKPWMNTEKDKKKINALLADLRERKRRLGILNMPKAPCLVCKTPLDPNGRKSKFCSKRCGIYWWNHKQSPNQSKEPTS